MNREGGRLVEESEGRSIMPPNQIITNNDVLKSTTFRLNNSASLTCGESELECFSFLLFTFKITLQLFEGLVQVKKLSDLKPT